MGWEFALNQRHTVIEKSFQTPGELLGVFNNNKKTKCDNSRTSTVDVLQPALSGMEQHHAACGLKTAFKQIVIKHLTLTFTAVQYSTVNDVFPTVYTVTIEKKCSFLSLAE